MNIKYIFCIVTGDQENLLGCGKGRGGTKKS